MNRKVVLALVGALVTTATVAPASAQRHMMRQPMKQLKSTAAATSSTPVTPKTLVCSNLQMGKTAYPEQNVQGPLKTTTTQDEAFAACNEIGAQNGEAYKTFNNCRVYKAGTNIWYTYLVQAPGVYDYSNDAYAKSIIGNATCTYNP